jgi:hypothetical protein
MGKRGRLFKKGIAHVVDRAIKRIQEAQDDWAQYTIEGFRTSWSEWISYVAPGLANVVTRLPSKTADIRTNIINRVTPVALYMHGMSLSYRRMKAMTAAATPTMVPAPATATARTPG